MRGESAGGRARRVGANMRAAGSRLSRFAGSRNCWISSMPCCGLDHLRQQHAFVSVQWPASSDRRRRDRVVLLYDLCGTEPELIRSAQERFCVMRAGGTWSVRVAILSSPRAGPAARHLQVRRGERRSSSERRSPPSRGFSSTWWLRTGREAGTGVMDRCP